jgi:hypothetical protein
MPELKTIAIRNRSITLYQERGVAAGTSKWTTTTVSGGGGGGYVHQGSGYSSTTPVSSTTHEHDQFFIRTSEGREVPVRVKNAKLALRDGHDVSVFWLMEQGKGEGPFVAVHNHTTAETTWMHTSSIGGDAMGCLSAAASAIGLVVGALLVLMAVIDPDNELSFFKTALIVGVAAPVAWFCWRVLSRRFREERKFSTAIVDTVNDAIRRVT